MAAIKRFFEKRKLAAKFKLAGDGQRLDAPNQGPSCSSSASRSVPRQAPSSDAPNRAASAALSRLQQDQQVQAKKPASKQTSWKSKEETQQEGGGIDYAQMKKDMKDAIGTVKPRMATRQISSTSTTSSEEPTSPRTHAPPPADTMKYVCPACPQSLPRNEIYEHLAECLRKDLANEPMLISITMIHSLNINKEKVKTCIETLNKYLQNIISHPGEEKYRKIRKGNKVFHEKVITIKGADEFLQQGCGFQMQDITNEQGEAQTFYILPLEAGEETVLTAKEMIEEAEPLVPTVDRCARVFSPSDRGNRIQLQDSFFSVTKDDIKREHQVRTDRVEQESMLRTQSMRDQDKQKRKYRYALIRVRLCDGYLIQGTFRANEHVSAVIDFVREHLALDWLPFALFTSMREELVDAEATIGECSLPPSSLLVMEVNSDVLEEVTMAASSEGQDVVFLNEHAINMVEVLQ